MLFPVLVAAAVVYAADAGANSEDGGEPVARRASLEADAGVLRADDGRTPLAAAETDAGAARPIGKRRPLGAPPALEETGVSAARADDARGTFAAANAGAPAE